MGLRRGLKNVFNSVAGSFPVIGPHDGIEAELMLAGKKPLTWSPVIPAEAYEGLTPKMLEGTLAGDFMKLEEGVRQGKLKSMDVVVHRYRDFATGEIKNNLKPEIYRHYCQPGKEEDMKRMAAFNQKLFNFEEPDYSLLQKDIGTYLGYRDKDVQLWSRGLRQPLRQASRFIQDHVHSEVRREKMLEGVLKISGFINEPLRSAYQGKVLHQIEKEQKKAEKKLTRKTKNEIKPS